MDRQQQVPGRLSAGQDRIQALYQAEPKLKDRLPALLREDEKPADNTERSILAQFAFDRKKFAFATRLLAEALASDPKLGDDLEAGRRYRAARAAALAADGQGVEETPLDGQVKAKFWRQALDWLKSEFSAWNKLLESESPREREVVLYRQVGWKYDGALASIRDTAALAKLPPEERAACNQFWTDMAATPKKANARHRAFLQEELADARRKQLKESPELAYLLAKIGQTLLEQELWVEAEPYLRECLTMREKTTGGAWTTFNTHSSLGGSLLGQKKYADAEPRLLKGYRGMTERESTIPPIGRDRVPEALDRLIDLDTATNKPDEVKKWRAERAKQLEVSPMPGTKD